MQNMQKLDDPFLIRQSNTPSLALVHSTIHTGGQVWGGRQPWGRGGCSRDTPASCNEAQLSSPFVDCVRDCFHPTYFETREQRSQVNIFQWNVALYFSNVMRLYLFTFLIHSICSTAEPCYPAEACPLLFFFSAFAPSLCFMLNIFRLPWNFSNSYLDDTWNFSRRKVLYIDLHFYYKA